MSSNTCFDVFGKWGLAFSEFIEKKQASGFRVAIGSVGLVTLDFTRI